MRRKSERTASKKAKESPEKKVEKVKRRSSRRKKQSTSSENESADEAPVVEPAVEAIAEVAAPSLPATESPEETTEQVWQVKTAEGSGDTGEIKKLKICLTRPPSTPERADRSPRSKRKHSRATSSSDADGSEEKKKTRHHRTRRNLRESNDSERTHESQSDEPEKEAPQADTLTSSTANDDTSIINEKQPESVSDDTPVSSTNDANETVSKETVEVSKDISKVSQKLKSPAADTTVTSPKVVVVQEKVEVPTQAPASESLPTESPVNDTEPEYKQSNNEEDVEMKQTECTTQAEAAESKEEQVSIQESVEVTREPAQGKESVTTNENNVVEKDVTNAKHQESQRNVSSDSNKDKEESQSRFKASELERTESVQSAPEVVATNGDSTPLVINRKRRWGSRANKGSIQKTITISTDILKEIIPDVKPVEFEEVIEEKKQSHHKRVEAEKIERPVLPKIVIDNTEKIEPNKDWDEKENIKSQEHLPLSNRKISIVKDDDIIIRPPSPPRNKQSSVLYITNLVRPFTLPQLKNLLQRTGKIVENGFWIDRIKSKCFVIYENEDQAVETRHALHGVTWPVSNPKALQVDFSTQEAFDKAKLSEENDTKPISNIPGTVEDWIREQDMRREQGETEKPWERRAAAVREWDMGKGDAKEEGPRRDDRAPGKRRRSQERSPEPARKFKKKEEEAPAKLLDDLFRKTKTTPCIYWLPLSAETIAVKEEQRRKHVAEHERRLLELRRTRERERRH